MSMILILHFLVHGLTGNDIPHNLYHFLLPLIYSGVDIFFLISGQFLIKFSKRSIVKFALTILFFSAVNILLTIIITGHIDLHLYKLIATFLFPVSYSGYWFIQVYFIMMISAPIVNAGLKALSQKQLLYAMTIFAFFAVYMRGDRFCFTYLNGMFCYCLGYALRTLNIASLFSKRTLLTSFFVVTLSAAILRYSFPGVGGLLIGRYSSPFTLLSAVTLYLYFSKLEFSSRAVNSIAAAALGCYLLQDGKFGFEFFYDFQHRFMLAHGYGVELFAMLAATFIGLWVASFLLTKFKDLWINQLTDKLISISDKVTGPLMLRLNKFIFREASHS